MADTDFTVKDGSGSLKTFLYDTIAGKLWSRIKLAYGPAGSAFEVADNKPLPAVIRDSSGVEATLVQLSTWDAVYSVPAIPLARSGSSTQKISVSGTHAETAAITGTDVVFCLTQPAHVVSGSAPVAVVDTDEYFPVGRYQVTIQSGDKISFVKPTGGTDGIAFVRTVG